jgi:hypothetical protein
MSQNPFVVWTETPAGKPGAEAPERLQEVYYSGHPSACHESIILDIVPTNPYIPYQLVGMP